MLGLHEKASNKCLQGQLSADLFKQWVNDVCC